LKYESPSKKTHQDDIYNARALRWPVQDGRRWIRLEELPIEPNPQNEDELWIVPGLAKWLYDQKEIVRRSYLHGRLYQLRQPDKGQARWYYQPEAGSPDEKPPHRTLVDDPELLAELRALEAKGQGRGPMSKATLRVRQCLVRSVMTCAWKKWGWLDRDYGAQISMERKPPGRTLFLTHDELRDVVIHATPGFDEALLAAAWIGWRKGNVWGLEWSRVVFPVRDAAGELLQPGVIWVESEDTKNEEPIAQPMTEHLEQLLLMRWEQRNGRLVFHQGDGKPWRDVRKRWRSTKVAASLPAEYIERLRIHDLRHTFASHMLQSGASDAEIMQAGGWRDVKSMRGYAHLRVGHLLEPLNRRHKRRD